jgi:hypothetical protein
MDRAKEWQDRLFQFANDKEKESNESCNPSIKKKLKILSEFVREQAYSLPASIQQILDLLPVEEEINMEWMHWMERTVLYDLLLTAQVRTL